MRVFRDRGSSYHTRLLSGIVLWLLGRLTGLCAWNGDAWVCVGVLEGRACGLDGGAVDLQIQRLLHFAFDLLGIKEVCLWLDLELRGWSFGSLQGAEIKGNLVAFGLEGVLCDEGIRVEVLENLLGLDSLECEGQNGHAIECPHQSH